MRKRILSIIIQLAVLQAFGQSGPVFHPPLKIPMLLSGNFGEIRPDHFHSGIDIKTMGTTGHHLFAIADGYVSRIKVQANGYGKSIYLTHPDGYTSVYGHLDRYREDIEAYVKGEQYRNRSHQLDLYLQSDQFRISKGDFIGYSGNSGGSSGPHLHFEVRTAADQHPTNVLKYGFEIADHRAPKFHTLYLVNTGETGNVNGAYGKASFNLVIDNGIYMVPWGTRLEAGGDLGIVAEVFDYLDGASNRCGVYSLEMFVDDRLVYSHMMDEFSFSETRYVNARMDYGEQVSSGKLAHRLYRLPNDRLRIYGRMERNGILRIDEEREYRIRVVATDVAGNRSEMQFSIAGRPSLNAPEPGMDSTYMHVSYDEEGVYRLEDMTLEIPANALYQDMDLTCSVSTGDGKYLTGIYSVGNPGVPLHRPATLSVKVAAPDPVPGNKLLLVQVTGEEISPSGGTYKDGVVTASIRNFGEFAVLVDTTAPEIIPLNGSSRKDLSGTRALRFTIRDVLSGIERYEGYIDNRWALFEYDPKNDLLVYTFDEKMINKGQDHELELYVADARGNVSLYHSTFTW